MDNSKYLALVDLMGKDKANQVRDNAAEFLASLDCEFRPEIRQDCGDGLDAVRWAGDAPVMVADPPITWRGMPLLCHDLDGLEDEWTCKYCGKVNPASATACGEGVWDGCGAPLPRCEEPPRGVLHMPQGPKPIAKFWPYWCPRCGGTFVDRLAAKGICPHCSYQSCTINPNLSDDVYHALLDGDRSFYPDDYKEVTVTHPGQTAREHRREIMARWTGALKGAMGKWA